MKRPSFYGDRLVVMSGILMLFNCLACTSIKPIPSEEVIQAETREEEIGQVRAKLPAQMTFDSLSYHFGEVTQGDTVYRELYFTNTGDEDLLIQLMSACECTHLDWPAKAIKPGQQSKIKVRYDSKNKKGAQIVDIEILANTQPETSFTKFYIFVKP